MLTGQWPLPAGLWGHPPQAHPVLESTILFPPMGIRGVSTVLASGVRAGDAVKTTWSLLQISHYWGKIHTHELRVLRDVF